MHRSFTAVFQPADEGGYIAWVEELPGANTQGETLDEARENLKEAIELILEVNRERALADVDETIAIREEIVVSAGSAR
ncbi:MAG TPA: type II toxin-antitoxin system HicB family antitoxin [Thermoanaerobaculia bacterium]